MDYACLPAGRDQLLMIKTLIILLASVVCGGVGQIFFKKGIRTIPHLGGYSIEHFLKFFGAALANPFVWLGILTTTFYFILWLLVLSLADVSWALPIRSVQIVFVALMATFFLGEKVSKQRWIGIGFVTLGILFVIRSWGGS